MSRGRFRRSWSCNSNFKVVWRGRLRPRWLFCAVSTRARAPAPHGQFALLVFLKQKISVTGLAVGGLELVELRAALGGDSAFGSLAVEVGSGAVVERGVQIDPDLGIGIAVILGRGRRFGQAQADEHA